MLGTAAHTPHARSPAVIGRGAGEPGFAALGQLEGVIDRIMEVVEEETQQLRRHAAVDLKDFNDRKSQGLLELTRALRQFDQASVTDALAGRLAALRSKLESNRLALKLHLDAVREVSTILSDAIRDADSDGTYSPSIRNGNRDPWSD